MEMSIQGTRYKDTSSVTGLADDGVTRLKQVPGVIVAATTWTLPVENAFSSTLVIESRPLGNSLVHGGLLMRPVSPEFPEVFRVPMLRGRFFTDRDTSSSASVATHAGQKGFIVTQVRTWDFAIPNDPAAPHLTGSEVNYVGIDGNGVLFQTAFISVYTKDRLFHIANLYYPGGKRSYVNHVDKMYSVEYDLPEDPLKAAETGWHCLAGQPVSRSRIKFIGYEEVAGVKTAHVTFGNSGDVWFWEEGGCLSLKEQGKSSKLETISIVHTDDASMFTAIPSDFKQATEREMADVRFRKVYGDNYMSKLNTCQKKIFTGPDPHDKFSEPKVIRDARAKSTEEAQPKK
jgi:hypothetical protein